VMATGLVRNSEIKASRESLSAQSCRRHFRASADATGRVGRVASMGGRTSSEPSRAMCRVGVTPAIQAGCRRRPLSLAGAGRTDSSAGSASHEHDTDTTRLLGNHAFRNCSADGPHRPATARATASIAERTSSGGAVAWFTITTKASGVPDADVAYPASPNVCLRVPVLATIVVP
jgi:hypothetical protein